MSSDDKCVDVAFEVDFLDFLLAGALSTMADFPVLRLEDELVFFVVLALASKVPLAMIAVIMQAARSSQMSE